MAFRIKVMLAAAVLLVSMCATALAQTTVTIGLGRGGQPYVDAVKAAAERYRAIRPDVQIEIISGYDREKFLVAAAGGTPPDIVTEGAQYVIPDALDGLLLPLDTFVRETGLDLADFVPPALDSVRLKGETYAIPLSLDVNFALLRNTRILSLAGVDATKPPETIEELDEISRKVIRVNNGLLEVAAFLPWKAGESGNGLFTMALAFGGSFWDPETETFTTVHPRNVQALEWMFDIAERYRGLGVYEGTRPSLASMLTNETLAMGLVWPNVALNLQRQNPNIEFALGPVPHLADGGNPSPVWVAGTDLAIPKGAKNPEEAFKFLAYLTADPEGNAIFSEIAQAFPAYLKSSYHAVLMEHPVWSVYHQLAVAARFARPPVPNQDFWTKTLNSAVNQVIDQVVPAREALIEADRLIRADYEETMRRLTAN